MEFDVLCTVSTGEVVSTIDGKGYKHFIDAAKIERFLKLYRKAPGKALNYLRDESDGYEVDGVRYGADRVAVVHTEGG